MSRKATTPTLSVRAALILMIASCCGLVIGVLTAMAGRSLAEAVIAGLVAAGSSAVAANRLIGE